MSDQLPLYAFNRGLISRLALARLDLKRTALSAAIQTNWMPRALGSMMLRPGWGYLGTLLGLTRMLPFVFATDDVAEIEMSAGAIRIWEEDTLLTRTAVSATITNGGFDTNLASWSDLSESGAAVAWIAGGYLEINGDGTHYGILEQAVVTASIGLPHALRIVIPRGLVDLRVGSTSLGAEVLSDTTLGVGTHSIVIVPTAGTFYLQLRSRRSYVVYVDSVSIEGAGALSLPSPYAADDLPKLRYEQSGDVVYIACRGLQQRKIERRDNGSWSVVLYQPEDGPFRVENTTTTTLTASAPSGGVNLVASNSVFRPEHVGALIALTFLGQRVETTFNSDNVFGDPIRVTGIGEARRFAIETSSVSSFTLLTLQRSVGILGSWQNVGTYNAGAVETFNDGLDGQIVYYRLGVVTGDYTDPTTTLLNYSSGNNRGVLRISTYTDDKNVAAVVIGGIVATTATDRWEEGSWSDFRGYPSVVAFHDGRLWWVGKDYFYGSVTDAFESFDPTYVGDAGPIQRSIGSGPIDNCNWALSLNRLVVGTDGAIVECRSSSLDEPLTPTNFTPKTPATKGSAPVDALKVDDGAVFVQRSGFRVLMAAYSIQKQGAEVTDLTLLVPEVCEPGVVAAAVQREPDTRLHFVLSDGTVAVCVLDASENINCWVKVETDGEVVDVVVTPGTAEDAVRYVVKRTVGGVDVYFFERWALESEARGGEANSLQWNKIADAFVTSASASSLSLPHLEGETVVVWGSGRDLGEFTVAGGVISLGATYTNVCAGLGYEARFQCTKLAYAVPPGKSGLGAKKRINQLGIVAADAHARGLRFGPDFDNLDDLPLIQKGLEVDEDHVYAEIEDALFEFPGEWDTDARLCLVAAAPRPFTVLAAVIDMTTHPKSGQ